MKRVLCVFPRRTKATPEGFWHYINRGPDLFVPDGVDEVHVSVTFTWDMRRAEQLAEEWRHVAPVKIGGPATGAAGGDFEPGMYLRPGYVITSRGCPNKCWFCSVPKREGALRELPIRDGWNVLDDNLLACSDDHVRQVFHMLRHQSHRPEFTGGLEAARLKPWHAEWLKALKPKQLFFAYDTADDLEPLRVAGRTMLDAGFTTASHSLRCYVLCGHPKDTTDAADKRMREAVDAGFVPMAMLWRDNDGRRDLEWAKFQRTWARPAIICRRAKA